MLLSKKSGNAERKQQQVDTREAFNIWDILSSKYMTLDRIQVWEDFSHDQDLILALNAMKKPLKRNVRILERMMERYAIESPDRNRVSAQSPVNPKVVSDEFIALDIFFYTQEHVENLLKALRSSMTNDAVRMQLKKMALTTIDELDNYILYLRQKGWLANPPRYRNVPHNVSEEICLCEAANLWDHLTYRYDNRKTTEIYYKAIHDTDFRLVLYIGGKQLTRQIKRIEAELRRYGLPMPKRPGKFTLGINDLQIFDDDHIYRVLLASIQGAAILHAQSFKECTVNDRVRAFFKKLLIEEIDMIDRLIKLGKVKGWLNPAPTYGP